MNFSLLLLYLLSVALLIVTPGPVVALAINTSLKAGTGRALLTVLGTNGASLVLALLAILILAGSLSLNEQLLNLVSFAGCLFIGHLGLQGLKDALRTPVDDRPQQALPSSRSGFVKGFLVGISNPKDIIFFVSFFPQFIQITPSFGHSALLLTVLWVLVDFSILGLYIHLASRMFSARHKARVTFASSLVLLLVAIFGAGYAARSLLVALH
ncbi:LysE family translocator [Pseudomonas vanderleydeniana]|uniref:LysE family translocator n=1 Tax=Pseudomonas vanderleydeniana TaxID=2745495 RepID=A0A9E6TR07_9PSED|nr:LysE family translocator [Pseudomonas vanderleydeniana]QXI26997.1 LysE family translocator [Pseudomonas vanderleydeniana]